VRFLNVQNLDFHTFFALLQMQDTLNSHTAFYPLDWQSVDLLKRL